MIAFGVYASYTLGLKRRPPIATLVFFLGVSLSALVTAVPLFIYEMIAGSTYWPSLTGFLALAFVTLGPSLTGQLAYMRGIELIGPGRAGLFPALVPCFGVLLAVIMLNEPFHSYHAVALLLGIGGIYLAERGRQSVVPETNVVSSNVKTTN